MFLRDPRTASKVFGMKDPRLLRIPRHKFLYYVNFVRVGGDELNDWRDGISMLANEVSRPRIAFDTETLNQYNKKRVVQKRVNYDTFTVTFWDTYSDLVYKIVSDYFRYYYGDPSNHESGWAYDQTMPVLHGRDFGYVPPKGDPSRTYFFDRIEVYEFGGGYHRKTTYIHPFITNIDYGNASYAEGQNGHTITITFACEGILFDESEKLTPSEIEAFGLDVSDVGWVNVVGLFNQKDVERKRGLKIHDPPKPRPTKSSIINDIEAAVNARRYPSGIGVTYENGRPVIERFDELSLEEKRKRLEYERQLLERARTDIERMKTSPDPDVRSKVPEYEKRWLELKQKYDRQYWEYQNEVRSLRGKYVPLDREKMVQVVGKKSSDDEKLDAILRSNTSEIGKFVREDRKSFRRRLLDRLKP